LFNATSFEVKAKLMAMGAEPAPSTPAEQLWVN
jgi:hypothetical protein